MHFVLRVPSHMPPQAHAGCRARRRTTFTPTFPPASSRGASNAPCIAHPRRGRERAHYGETEFPMYTYLLWSARVEHHSYEEDAAPGPPLAGAVQALVAPAPPPPGPVQAAATPRPAPVGAVQAMLAPAPHADPVQVAATPEPPPVGTVQAMQPRSHARLVPSRLPTGGRRPGSDSPSTTPPMTPRPFPMHLQRSSITWESPRVHVR